MKTYHPVEIRPHEREALRQLASNARALAGLIPDEHNDGHAKRLRTWASAADDILDRLEAGVTNR